MEQTDAMIFREALAMWDRPLSELRGHKILEVEDDVEIIVEDVFTNWLVPHAV